MEGLNLAGPSAIYGGDFGDLGQFVPGFIYTDVAEFRKALTSGYGTDAASFTQGRALQFESLEPQLISVVEDLKEHFPLLDSLEKSDATSVVDQWTRRDAIGGYAGGETNTETGTMTPRTGTYVRKTDEVKFLTTMAQVSKVQQSTRSQEDAVTVENENAILRLVRTAEFLSFYGDQTCVPTEFDGIRTILAREAPADHIYDLRGKSLSPDAAEFIDSNALIADQGNFGLITHGWMSNAVKGDLDKKLDPKHRYNPDGRRVRMGTPVEAVDTDWGPIRTRRDIWIKEGQAPFVARGGVFPGIVTDAAVTPPGGVVATVVPATAGSLFATDDAGLYYYAVEGVNKDGRSTLAKSLQVNVPAGASVSLAITETPGGNETAYYVHRSSLAGGNADGDFREMVRVKKAGTGTTTVVDINRYIPGTSQVFLLNQNPNRRAITLRRLLPISQFPLAATNSIIIPWAVIYFLYLRLAIPRHHRVIDNVLPSTATWKPK